MDTVRTTTSVESEKIEWDALIVFSTNCLNDVILSVAILRNVKKIRAAVQNM